MCARFASGQKIPVGNPFSTGVAIRKQNYPGGARGKREKSEIFPEQFVDKRTTPGVLRWVLGRVLEPARQRRFTVRSWPAIEPASPATGCSSPGAHPRRYRWRIVPAFQILTVEC